MSDAELRKQSRYTWWLVAFSAVVIWFLAQQTRATAKQEIPAPTVKISYFQTSIELVS